MNYGRYEIVAELGRGSMGVVEAEEAAEEMFGNNNLTDCIHRKKPPMETTVVDAVHSWRGRAEVNDDTTVLEIRHEQY